MTIPVVPPGSIRKGTQFLTQRLAQVDIKGVFWRISGIRAVSVLFASYAKRLHH